VTRTRESPFCVLLFPYLKMLTPLWDNFEYKDHQVSGVEWMLAQEDDDFLRGGILCDEMGLG
jgi:SNF2 family DNA or RNA helicase